MRPEVDEFNDIREYVYEYPGPTEDEKTELFFSKDEASARSLERNTMIEAETYERARFVACVEELFQISTGKRENPALVRSMTDEQIIDALVSSEYRGYEHKCCRAIVSCRKRAIRQIASSHWIRGKQEMHEVASKLSKRQVQFALLVARGDAKLAMESP